LGLCIVGEEFYLRFCRHHTKPIDNACISKVICRIPLQFLLSLPQTAAASYITQVVGEDNRR
jgi:hypothetical protein